ncbi:hypothetical protein VCHENC02_1028B, partial [Vibrio harveyi]
IKGEKAVSSQWRAFYEKLNCLSY